MDRQRAAEDALQRSQIMRSLAAYSPTVVSTIWAGLDIASSDIDVVCQYTDQEQFKTILTSACSHFPGFNIVDNHEYVVARFTADQFEIEVFASALPIDQQAGYIHFLVMQRLVELGGAEFQAAVRSLKRSGLKTEPAIAQLLHLAGDPYEAVAALRDLPDHKLTELMENRKNV